MAGVLSPVPPSWPRLLLPDVQLSAADDQVGR